MTRIAAVFLLALALFSPFAAAADAPQPLYERLGGDTAIRKVVDDFVALAAPDPAVDFTRGGTWQATPAAVEGLKQHLVAFVAQATGGPKSYTGRDMKTVHAGMRITRAQFDALAAHLRSALEENGVGAAEAGELMKVAGSTAADIVEVK